MNLKQAIEIVESAGFDINDVKNIELKMGYLTFETNKFIITTEETSGGIIKVIGKNLEVDENLFRELIDIKTLVTNKFNEINNIVTELPPIQPEKMTTVEATEMLNEGFNSMKNAMQQQPVIDHTPVVTSAPEIKNKRGDYYTNKEWKEVPEIYKKDILSKIKTGSFIKIPVEDLIRGAQTAPIINNTPEVVEINNVEPITIEPVTKPVIDVQPLTVPPVQPEVVTTHINDIPIVNTVIEPVVIEPVIPNAQPEVISPSTGTNLDELLGLKNE